MNDKYLTISVDDGHPADLISAELLSTYRLRATFYIPRTNAEREVMTEPDIKRIAQSFEIGGHTVSHEPLDRLREDAVRKEVREGKDWMEQLLGRQVRAFCYPRGKFNRVVVNAVRDAGFMGARTCMFNLCRFPQDPFLWGVSTHAYSHPVTVQVRHAAAERNIEGMINFFRICKGAVDWLAHFKHAVDYVDRNGGIAHLYYHSWEIEQMHAWGRLEDAFRYASAKKDLKGLTNGELFAVHPRHQRTA